MQKEFDFTGKNVLITGAGSGIGKTAAIEFARRGAQVFIVGRRREKLTETTNDIKEAGGKCLAETCDVSDSKAVTAVVASAVKQLGQIDILVNAAGVTDVFAVGDMGEEEAKWKKQIDTNLNGTAYMCGAVVEDMAERRYGRIINVASVNAFVTSKTVARHGYNASKAGVCGLTRGMSSTYAGSGITVNAVCPGLFESEMTEELFANKIVMATFNKQVPASRPGREEEIAGPILFLASDFAAYITGQCIAVDGGMSTASYL